MAFPDLTPDLRRAMPDLRGALAANAPLSGLTFFRTGGPAQILFEPADEADLSYFLQRLDPSLPVVTLGAGSNLLVRDGGLKGVVIRLGRPFEEIAIEGLRVTAGAAARDMKLALVAGRAGVAGLSFLRGVPGSIGGALRMNAGAYGSEIKDRLISCRGVDRAGRIIEFANADMGFSYRHSAIGPDIIFTGATFEGLAGESEKLMAEMAEITAERGKTQPVNSRTGGSTFKNPPGHKAWALIDAAGCRGLRIGDAQISELHCNFLINQGAASAADIEALGEEVRARVKAKSGVTLEWEILRVGEA
ncbi:UDP-N-acetylmuramate dehydrogenase [Methylocella silvestris]|uniref:UDP-N-acetylenolpyruvoylglucosamine reductase n=1 Tax=Methylocella silvestris TaxID=199596 RepID=A0A2J7TLC9_METSI|nr:UDP-N-acetylmuramate dehydrogenase [Methylocella silvestris]PNG27569.1 UDP-N-acetylenolpyruvoylglucosamine reductase [Methylocella silvestris]